MGGSIKPTPVEVGFPMARVSEPAIEGCQTNGTFSCNFFAPREGNFAAIITGTPGQRNVDNGSAVVSRAGVGITADYPFEQYYATAYGDFFDDLSSVSATTPSEYRVAAMNATAYGAGSSSEKAVFIRPPKTQNRTR
ncbi:MAG: hypothetical protein ACOCZB_07265 [Spirochaetota bacterium]